LPQAERPGATAPSCVALVCEGVDRPGTLHAITTVILAHSGNITGIEIPERGERARVHVEIDLPSGADIDRLVADLRALDVLAQVEIVPTMAEVYGKRIIVVGGGAQVGQVALGAISEADRHNIRGEKISIEVRRHGILVVSLNMAGSAPKAADLIVSDPVQAGVMAVMAVARTASFDIARQRGRTY